MNPAGFATAIASRLIFDEALPSRPRNSKYATNPFAAARRAETTYARQLRKVARHVGELINAFTPGDPEVVSVLMQALERYAQAIDPWAQATARRMLEEVARRDERAWAQMAQTMRRALRQEIREAPTGQAMQKMLEEQVSLIRSIPLDAAKRVHELTLEGLTSGARAKEIVPMIMESGSVTVARANLIARTEVARTASALTQVRAQHVGSIGYIWRTARDGRVRPCHKKLEGKYCGWDSPPIAEENGRRYHAGQGPNDRCYAEPIIPEIVK